jgi:hypothetical protein
VLLGFARFGLVRSSNQLTLQGFYSAQEDLSKTVFGLLTGFRFASFSLEAGFGLYPDH